MEPYWEKESSKGRKISLAIVFVVAGILCGLILSRIFIIPYRVIGDSMAPSFRPHQKILFLKHTAPVFGDIVLIKDSVSEGTVYMKRIIGLSGDTIEIKNQVIYRNSEKLTMSWRSQQNDTRNFPMGFSFRDNMPMVKMSRNEFFVLNDNLDDSFDSRTFGKISSKAIIGKLIYIFKP